MKAKVVSVGELVFRNEKALAKLLAAIAEADTLPNYNGSVPAIEVRDIDEKEIEYRGLPNEERGRFESWREYARGETKDSLQAEFDASPRLQSEHSFSFARFREARIRGWIEAGDRGALVALIDSFGSRYATRMPQDLQVEIIAFLLRDAFPGKTREDWAKASPDMRAAELARARPTLDLSGVKAVASGAMAQPTANREEMPF